MLNIFIENGDYSYNIVLIIILIHCLCGFECINIKCNLQYAIIYLLLLKGNYVFVLYQSIYLIILRIGILMYIYLKNEQFTRYFALKYVTIKYKLLNYWFLDNFILIILIYGLTRKKSIFTKIDFNIICRLPYYFCLKYF